MLQDEKLQLAGPVSVVGAILCAELGAHALAHWPTSSLLWYLNLEVFRSLRYGLALGSDGISQVIWVAIPLVGLVGTGLVARSKLFLAIASNLSLLYSAALLYGSVVVYGSIAGDGLSPWLRFKLSELGTPSGIFTATILLLSFLSTIISHRSYWREIFPLHGNREVVSTSS